MFATRVIQPSTRQALRFTPINRPFTMTRIAAMSTVSDAIKKDHRELESYYDQVVNSADKDRQLRFGNQFTWELARHSIAEELVVYPAFEKYLGNTGHEMAESDRREHHRVKELLNEFQKMSPSNSAYVPKLKELMTVLADHIEDEETSDLPALEKALQMHPTKDSEDLAKSFERTKMFVPTRSHPSAGERPMFEGPMGLMMAPIDRLRDMFRKFPESK